MCIFLCYLSAGGGDNSKRNLMQYGRKSYCIFLTRPLPQHSHLSLWHARELSVQKRWQFLKENFSLPSVSSYPYWTHGLDLYLSLLVQSFEICVPYLTSKKVLMLMSCLHWRGRNKCSLKTLVGGHVMRLPLTSVHQGKVEVLVSRSHMWHVVREAKL